MKTQVVATLALAAGCAQAFVAPRIGLNKPAVVQARYVACCRLESVDRSNGIRC